MDRRKSGEEKGEGENTEEEKREILYTCTVCKGVCMCVYIRVYMYCMLFI